MNSFTKSRGTLYDSRRKDQTAPRLGETHRITQRSRCDKCPTARPGWPRLAESSSWGPDGERPPEQRRPQRPTQRRGARRRCRPGRVRRRGLGRTARAGRAAGRRRHLPPRQGVRRRADPAGHGRAGTAGARRLGARPGHQPRAAGARLRPGPRAALARRPPARPRVGRAADRARRPDPAGGRRVRRADAPRRPRRGRRARGHGGRRASGRALRHRRGPGRGRLPLAGRRRRRALAARPAAGPDLAPRDRVRGGGPRLRRDRARRRLDLLATSSCAASRASCCPATAGSSRSAAVG